MVKYNTKVLGFGDNVVDLYEHSHMMYPGGNCVNLCAYSKMFGVERAAYMGYFGDDEAAKEHLKFIHSLGPELVSLTRGSKGCIMYDGEQFYTQPATLIDNVVDTMGAGDSFLTSFMDCYIDQLKRGTDRQEAIRTSLKEASKFAAHVCTLNGAFGYGKPYED